MGSSQAQGAMQGLATRLEGDCLGDAFSLGRYATDASIYQVLPAGVVIPKSVEDVQASISFARQQGLSVLPRGGGTSQCGQTVNHSLVIDNTKFLNDLISLDVANRRCVVQPGIVLDELNRMLKPHGLWFPVDVSTASRATIGGMAANNSCGGRSLRYGTMRNNVRSISGFLANGQQRKFTEVARPDPGDALVQELLFLGAREASEISERFPNLLRRVGGYNIDALTPRNGPNNLAHLLVGSEGTLSYFTEIELCLAPLPGERVMGVCHFPTFASAMNAAQHLVTLHPQAVELVDDTMIALARNIPAFRKTVETVVSGGPAALLLVEFAEGAQKKNLKKLDDLSQMMGDLGFAFGNGAGAWGGSVAVTDPGLQGDIAEFRKAGLNIMMSMKDEGKPVSFVEDCAVALPDLAAYTAGLTEIFERHGTRGTWYAHASVGCLHVRPILNMKLDKDVRAMRAIAEECFDLVKSYKGSHSGEHGDGISRSEFHEKMFGGRMVRSFEEVKSLFDPDQLFNPNRVVHPPRMDDRRLFRYGPGYGAEPFQTVFDWSAWPGAGGGFQGAVEMCNNNGACRKLKGGVMCPSFRVTRDERDVVRGRANTLRMAITGQLGTDALTSDDMIDTMGLCVSCKACKSECPTGVDMAKMKIEVLAARRAKRGLALRDRIVGFLPRYAPYLSRVSWLANTRDRVPGMAALTQPITGFSKSRKLPEWSSRPFRNHEYSEPDPDVVVFADVFNRYFEPENLRSACRLLRMAGLRVHIAGHRDGGRDLDCGRTMLSIGAVDEARGEAIRTIDALLPYANRGIPIIGLEPSSLLTLRDEIPALLPGPDSAQVASSAQMFEQFFVTNKRMAALQFNPLPQGILLHGHCHQKAHSEMSWVHRALSHIPETAVTPVETSCCGMAGAFGYRTNTAEVSLNMAELSLFPAIRRAPDQIIAADGFSCRHQIMDGTGRQALHVARILEMAVVEA